MRKHGLVIHSVPENVVTEWEARARRAYPRLMGELVPREMVAEVQRLRDAYRAKKNK